MPASHHYPQRNGNVPSPADYPFWLNPHTAPDWGTGRSRVPLDCVEHVPGYGVHPGSPPEVPSAAHPAGHRGAAPPARQARSTTHPVTLRASLLNSTPTR